MGTPIPVPVPEPEPVPVESAPSNEIHSTGTIPPPSPLQSPPLLPLLLPLSLLLLFPHSCIGEPPHSPTENSGSARARVLQEAVDSGVKLPPDPGIKVVPVDPIGAEDIQGSNSSLEIDSLIGDLSESDPSSSTQNEASLESSSSSPSPNDGAQTPPPSAAGEAQGLAVWPEELTSASVWGDYVSAVNIQHDGVQSCEGVKPKNSEHVIQGHLHDRDIRPLHAYSLDDSGTFQEGQKRIVVWTAMNGLGNVLRGFLSGFFYGILSGRQLLRWETGSHARVMSSLCHGFECPYIDVLHYRGKLPKHTMNICHRDLSPTLGDPRPVFHCNCDYLENFWVKNDSLSQCALDTIGCASYWCALSKAEVALLGPPTPWLGSIIDESFSLSPALGSPPFPVPEKEPEGSTPRSLRLKFDLALHIRTLYRCVETNPSGPGCKGGGVEHAVASAMFSSALRKFILGGDWNCMSRLLAFTHNLKNSKTDLGTDQGKNTQPPLFDGAGAVENLQWFLDETSKVNVPHDEMWAPWTVERAKELATELIGDDTQKKKLSIFVATDSEVLRPLFVEFLRPYGHVVQSTDSVVHLDRGTNDERRRLPTVAEFYLLSRASIVVSFTRRLSSFTQHAAMYGNGTLISRGGNTGCKFKAEHTAETPLP